MNLTLLGVIIIGAVLLAIVSAFIFSKSFRQDVIHGQGKAKIGDMISVEGVIIVVIIVVMVGALVYLVNTQQIPADQNQITLASAIDKLKSDKSISFKLYEENGRHFVKAEDRMLGEIHADINHKLKVFKDSHDAQKWLTGADSSKLGYITLEMNRHLNLWKAHNGIFYRLHQPYRVGKTELWFKIDSIYNTHISGKTFYHYQLSFGQGESENNVTWPVQEKFDKTTNGEIDESANQRFLSKVEWESNYYVALGIGQPAYDSISNSFPGVEKLNMLVLEGRIE